MLQKLQPIQLYIIVLGHNSITVAVQHQIKEGDFQTSNLKIARYFLCTMLLDLQELSETLRRVTCLLTSRFNILDVILSFAKT